MVQIYYLFGHELWQLLEKSFELRSASGAEGHSDFLQLSGVKVLFKDERVIRVFLTDHSTFEDELPDNDARYLPLFRHPQ